MRGCGDLGPDLVARAGTSGIANAIWKQRTARCYLERLERSYRDATGSQIVSPKARFIQWRTVLRKETEPPRWARDLMMSVSLTCHAMLRRKCWPSRLCRPALVCNPAFRCRPIRTSNMPGLTHRFLAVVAQMPPRPLFQRGARSLQWQAEDRNSDTLSIPSTIARWARTNFPHIER